MSNLQITHNGKTYRYIGDKWGKSQIDKIELSDSGEVLWRGGWFNTCNTPDELVSLGSMELVEEKPEEKVIHINQENFDRVVGMASQVLKIREEIERRIESIKSSPFDNGTSDSKFYKGKAYKELLTFIDSLTGEKEEAIEQPKIYDSDRIVPGYTNAYFHKWCQDNNGSYNSFKEAHGITPSTPEQCPSNTIENAKSAEKCVTLSQRVKFLNNHYMDNKDLRERFLNQFEDSKRKNELLAFIEQEVSLAYQRGREDMRKECLECLPPANKTYFENEGIESGGYNGGIKDCRTAISSIK